LVEGVSRAAKSVRRDCANAAHEQRWQKIEPSAVVPDLVVRGEDGKVMTVRYEAVNAMLLNEFLKEHRKVEELTATITEQEATNAQQQKQIEALTAGLQKVTARVESGNSAPRVVSDN